MKIFLSYPSESRGQVVDVAAALKAEGQDVFFDEDELEAGRSYNDRIRKAIRGCDLFIFFITPESVTKGRYTLSELLCARERWSNPSNRILPVMLEATPMADVPPTLKSIKILEPPGNLAADVSRQVEEIGRSLPIAATEPDAIQMAPAPPKPLLGRDALVDSLSDALLEDTDRPVSLAGSGGVGKSALASELCHRLADRFPGGVLWSKLGTQPSVPAELNNWARVACPSLDLSDYSDEERAVALRAELARRGPMLCVVDDVWKPAGLLREALPAACRIIITSRTLEVAKAHRGRPFEVDGLDHDTAKRLFLELADVAPKEELEVAVDTIVEACSGLPLALEIAAGLVDDSEDVKTIANRLSETSEVEVLRSLTDGETAASREGSVEACFAVSYDALSEEDQRRFRALGAFARGGMSQSAIMDVWHADDEGSDAAGSLQRFRRRHLLARDPATGSFRLPNLLRSYAEKLLRRAGESGAVGERHKNHYLSRLKELSWQELEASWPQMAKIWAWLLEFDLDEALEFVLEIGEFQRKRGHDSERAKWLSALLERRSGSDASVDGARLLYELGESLCRLDRDEESRAHFESALEVAERLGETDLAIDARLGLAGSFIRQGDDDRAWTLYEEALAEAQNSGPERRARCVHGLSNLHWRHKRLGKAAALAQQALTLVKQSSDDEEVVVSTQTLLCSIYRDQGRFGEQLDLATEAVAVLERQGDLPELHGAMEHQALALNSLGRLDEALDIHRRVLEGAQRIGDRQQEAETLGQMGWIYAQRGLHEQSLQLCEDSLAVQQEIGNQMCSGRRLNDLARLLEERGETDRCLDALRRALEIQVEIRNLADQLFTHHQMARSLEGARKTAEGARLVLPRDLAGRAERCPGVGVVVASRMRWRRGEDDRNAERGNGCGDGLAPGRVASFERGVVRAACGRVPSSDRRSPATSRASGRSARALQQRAGISNRPRARLCPV